jgi:hypothetical protein
MWTSLYSPDRVTVAATVQVKTRTYGRDQGWHFKDKHERLVSLTYRHSSTPPVSPTTS